jgi:hypothetical protein
VIGWEPVRRALYAKHVNSLAAQSSGKIMSVGRPSGIFVRCATEDCSCALVDIDVLEEGRDLVERGRGKRLWRVVSVVGAEFSTDASRSRAEHVLLSYSK